MIVPTLRPNEIRDLNREIDERMNKLGHFQELAVIRGFDKKGRCTGIGFNEKDLILRNFARWMGGLVRPKPIAGTETDVTLTDITNASKTVCTYSTGSSSLFNNQSSGSVLGFGNPATTPTPTRTDYELASLVTQITPSSTTTDETNWRVIVTGSYVWVAGGTAREAGLYAYWQNTVGSAFYCLLYHDAVSDVVVAPAGTVSVTYTTQF